MTTPCHPRLHLSSHEKMWYTSFQLDTTLRVNSRAVNDCVNDSRRTILDFALKRDHVSLIVTQNNMAQGSIEQLIAQGETITLEFKDNFDREAIEAAVAFANTKGGTILIGVSDKGQVKGISVGRETLRNWSN